MQLDWGPQGTRLDFHFYLQTQAPSCASVLVTETSFSLSLSSHFNNLCLTPLPTSLGVHLSCFVLFSLNQSSTYNLLNGLDPAIHGQLFLKPPPIPASPFAGLCTLSTPDRWWSLAAWLDHRSPCSGLFLVPSLGLPRLPSCPPLSVSLHLSPHCTLWNPLTIKVEHLLKVSSHSLVEINTFHPKTI